MSMVMVKIQGQPILLPSEWANLIDYCQRNPYCEMNLKVQDGIPIMIEEVKNKIKL